MLVSASFLVGGQNLYRFAQYNFIRGLYNPGAIGTDAPISGDLIYRNQWNGIEGAPKSVGFNGSYDINQSMAVGLGFYNDRTGLNQTNSFSAQYAYRLIFAERKYLAFGIGVGADNFSWKMDGSALDPTNDPAFSSSYSVMQFNSSFGIYYRSKVFYAGLSVPQLFNNSIAEKGLKPEKWHYMAVSGYYYEMSENFILNPSVQLKMALNAPLQADVVVRGIYTNIGFNVGFRSEMSLIAGIDYMFRDKIRIGYSFNYDVGQLSRVKGMSNEIYIGFGLPYYFIDSSSGQTKYVARKGNFGAKYNRASRRKERRFKIR